MKVIHLRLVVFGFIFSTSVLSAMSISKHYSINVTNVSQISSACANLAKSLFDVPTAVSAQSQCRSLSMSNSEDCLICAILNMRALLFEPGAWSICAFGPDQQGFSRLNLRLYNDERMCSLDELRIAYEKVIAEMSGGWVLSTIEQNPDIIFKISSITNMPQGEWLLFLKDWDFCAGAVFIKNLIKKFNLGD